MKIVPHNGYNTDEPGFFIVYKIRRGAYVDVFSASILR